MKNLNGKTIAVISLGWLGDTIINEMLCCNIKKLYPDSRLVLIVSKTFEDLGKIMTCDKCYSYDKSNEHKGVTGLFKLVKQIKKQEKIHTAILTHTHERTVLFAKLLSPKTIASVYLKNHNPLNLFINKHYSMEAKEFFSTYRGNFNANMLRLLCNNYEIDYKTNIQIPHEEDLKTKEKFKDIIPFEKDYIAISTTSKQEANDWDINEIVNFTSRCELPVVFIGTGRAHDIAQKIKSYNLPNFIDITNKTTIMDTAVILSKANCVISVDTGTMHMAYLLNKPTICLFHQPIMIPQWYPAYLDNVKILVGHKYLDEKTKKIIKLKEIQSTDVLNLVNQLRSK